MKKTVLITGASRGIGASIALAFAKAQYNVIINYNKSEKEAIKLEKKLNKITKAISVKADVTNDIEVKEMFKVIKKEFKKIDVLVNNAGISNDTEPFSKTKEDFMKVLDVNVYGVYNVTRYAKEILNKDSSIINIASTNGIDSYYEYSLDYDASKAAVINLTHNLANYLKGIRVNAIAPGWVDTDMNKNLGEYKNQELKKILLNRFADPKEVAEVALFLASDKASYINDTIIKVDGGRRNEY